MRCCLRCRAIPAASCLVAAGPLAALRDILDGISRNLISYSHCGGKASPLQSASSDFSGRGKYPEAGGFSCRKGQLLSPSPSHIPKLILAQVRGRPLGNHPAWALSALVLRSRFWLWVCGARCFSLACVGCRSVLIDGFCQAHYQADEPHPAQPVQGPILGCAQPQFHLRSF